MSSIEPHNLQIVMILTAGFVAASILGYISQKLRLSILLGYLVAGYLIGPYSPGFVVDMQLSEQLAEIGVILMMFGVGLHFKWEDLVRVKQIAIPGAILQTAMATIVGASFVYFLGWPLTEGLILGLAIGVASTVVLVRVLADNNLLGTYEGHIAVGWLIVEDVLTVLALLFIPIIVDFSKGFTSITSIVFSAVFALLKFVLLAAFMFTLGSRLVKYALFEIARTRSHELFTLSVLALTFLIATGSALLFGTSIALGAFIAGMVIGQTDLRHQASANSVPLKDVFVVIFFLSVGVLFNPAIVYNNFPLFIGVLGIIIIIKPLTALLILLFTKHTWKQSLTVAVALAQIGEFSFILAEEAIKFDIFRDEGYDVIVACAIVSISLNPILFKGISPITRFLERKDAKVRHEEPELEFAHQALVVGFGPIGQKVTETLEMMGLNTVVIDRNIDTITQMREEGKQAVYGDAASEEILHTAQLQSSRILVITVPETEIAIQIIKTARELCPEVPILARAKYLKDENVLKEMGVAYVSCEEQSLQAFNRMLHEMLKRKNVSPIDLYTGEGL